jgi:hypothetical protein
MPDPNLAAMRADVEAKLADLNRAEAQNDLYLMNEFNSLVTSAAIDEFLAKLAHIGDGMANPTRRSIATAIESSINNARQHLPHFIKEGEALHL